MKHLGVRIALGPVILAVLSGVVQSEILASPSVTSAQEASERDGLQLLHRLQSALGGAQRLASIHDFEETIDAQAWDANGAALGEVRKRTRWMRTPHVVRLDQRGPRGTYVLYFDGGSDAGWEILPDLTSADLFKTTGAATDLAGGELRFAQGYLRGFELTLWLADQQPGYRVTSTAPSVLRIAHGADATDFTLDPVTNLVVKSAGVSLADPDHPVPAEMHYEDWKTISGVQFPMRRVNFHSGLKRGEVTTTDLRINAGLRAADLAAKPADFAPDFRRR
jgi:hypothetical protein